MSKGDKQKYEIRFYVNSDVYHRIKKYADQYSEPISPFCRHMVIDRISALEVADANRGAPDMYRVLKEMSDSGVFSMIASDINQIEGSEDTE